MQKQSTLGKNSEAPGDTGGKRKFYRLTIREKTLILTLLPFLLLGALLPSRIAIATSPSLDHRIFFLGGKPSEGRIASGDYLLFTYDGERVIKQAACLPGERITAIDGEYACNDKFLGRALVANSLGEPLPRFHYNGVVPPGKLFLAGTHERSYDSRYIGFVDLNEITRKVYPLWPLW